jgi:DNA polymerase-3 subunit alpha
LSDPQIQEFSTLLAFPGIVTNAQHRMNKQGKPFGTFTLEDQFGAMEMRLFGDDYLKFKHYLADGTFLFIHGQWKKRFANSEESELKISEIKLLQDLSSTVKGLEFTIPVERINTQLAELFLQYIQNHPGELQLKLYLLDEAARFEIPMVSERFKVAYDPHGVKILENGCETKGKLI